jgi:hypothetical protein
MAVSLERAVVAVEPPAAGLPSAGLRAESVSPHCSLDESLESSSYSIGKERADFSRNAQASLALGTGAFGVSLRKQNFDYQ